MWSYYGSKKRLSIYYPKPTEGEIIEPFAGAAGYSLRWFDREVLLVDKNPMVISIWNYLQQCSTADIKSLKCPPAYSAIKRDDFDCEGQYHLMRFMIVQAAYGGNNVVSKWGAIRFQNNIRNVLENLFKIKHWRFICGSYEEIENRRATWFIDPPYQFGGHKYPMGNRKINYANLAEWIKSRTGQIIACENTKATWMDFQPMIAQQGVQHKTTEAYYTNMPTNIATQQSLFP